MSADDILRVPAGFSSDNLDTVIEEWSRHFHPNFNHQTTVAYIRWEIERLLTGDTRPAVFGDDGPHYL